jgi:hypothetical protein
MMAAFLDDKTRKTINGGSWEYRGLRRNSYQGVGPFFGYSLYFEKGRIFRKELYVQLTNHLDESGPSLRLWCGQKFFTTARDMVDLALKDNLSGSLRVQAVPLAELEGPTGTLDLDFRGGRPADGP